jgi:hypothetical protein
MPMNIEAHQKITTAHLSRLAYLRAPVNATPGHREH